MAFTLILHERCMKTPTLISKVINGAFVLLIGCCCISASHAGVTIITHGLNGNVDGWITGMANNIPKYPGFSGTNFSCYQMSFSNSGGGYLLTAARVAGSPATTPE